MSGSKTTVIKFSEIVDGELSIKDATAYVLPFFSHRQSEALMTLVNAESTGGVGIKELINVSKAIIYKITTEGETYTDIEKFFAEKDIDINSLTSISTLVVEMMDKQEEKKSVSAKNSQTTLPTKAVEKKKD